MGKRRNENQHEKKEIDEEMGEFEDRWEDDMDDGEGEVIIHNSDGNQ